MKGGRVDWGGVSLSPGLGAKGLVAKGLVAKKFFGSFDFDFTRHAWLESESYFCFPGLGLDLVPSFGFSTD